jgi:thioesterase domain-containing protein
MVNEMSGLKEKAKTGEQISAEIDKFYTTSVYRGAWANKTKGMTYEEFVKLKETKWIKVEDAQKLEDRINYLDADRERMERLYSQALQKIVDLKNGHLELKQKLQTLYNSLPIQFEKFETFREFYELGSKDAWEKWLKKFEELLKEEKQSG